MIPYEDPKVLEFSSHLGLCWSARDTTADMPVSAPTWQPFVKELVFSLPH